MLKSLAILALAFNILPVQAYAQTNKTHQTTERDKPSPSVAPVSSQDDGRTRLQGEHQDHVEANVRVVSTPAKDGYDKAAIWINLTLALIGMAGIGAAFVTLRKLERQTAATEKQANHMIASERALLVISSVTKSGSVIRPGFSPYYWWQVKNLGSTPARLIATQAHCKVDTAGLPKPLPEEPTFDERAVELHERILGPGDTLDFFSLWEKEDGTTFRDRLESLDQVCLRAYGYIRYRTMFGPEICESRFCDYFNHFPDKPIATSQMQYVIDFSPDLTAPAAYTKST